MTDVRIALQHPYGWPGEGQEAPVYRGALLLQYIDEDPQQLDGELLLRWSLRPQAMWRALETASNESALPRMLAGLPVRVGIVLPESARPLPARPDGPWNPHGAEEVGGPWLQQPVAIGGAADLDEVVFFLVNAPLVHDLRPLTDPSRPGRVYSGRLTAAGGGWLVTVDQHPDGDPQFAVLREHGGYRATHVVRAVRADGGLFSPIQAKELISGVATAYAFAGSRRIGTVLPVGARAGGPPSWALFGDPSSEAWENRLTWLDPFHGGGQLTSILPGWLDQWEDPLQQLVLRLAVGYHRTASEGDPLDVLTGQVVDRGHAVSLLIGGRPPRAVCAR